MSILNSVSESQRSNRKEYRRLLKRLTNCFRHKELQGQEADLSYSLLDDEEAIDERAVEDNEEMKEYVKNFRVKVINRMTARLKRNF